MINRSLQAVKLPQSYQESTTVAIRKPKKDDYSLPGSYRPVALENTLAKLVEKIVARQLTGLAEDKGMIPWNQLSGRKKRSTVTAVELLTSCAHTA